MIFSFLGNEYFAEGAKSCSPTSPHEFIMKSYEPRICERVNYFVHPECGKKEGLYLTDSRCQPPPGFPFEKLSTIGSFTELKMDKTIFKMGETIFISGNSYTTVGLPDEDIGIRVFNSEGTKILDFKSKIIRTGNDFQFKIETGNLSSINVEDDYLLRVVNYGKYGSAITQEFTVSNDGLPIPIKPEPIPVTSTTNTPEPSNQIMVEVSEPNSSGINWTMIGGFVIVGIIIVVIIFKKIRSFTVSNSYGDYEEQDSEEDYNDPNDPMYPTRDDLENNFKRYTWEQAEDLTALLFRAKGYSAKVGVPTKDKWKTKRSGDHGIDVRAEIDNVTVGIQVKHWESKNVNEDSVIKTNGSRNLFDHLIIISVQSGFEKNALIWAKEPGNLNKLELWDSEKFKDQIKKYLLEQDTSHLKEEFRQDSNLNHYQILGVSKNSSQDEIKDAFRRLSLKFHPDKEPSALSSESMKKIIQAYDTLKDPEKRNAYDQTL